jgi:hypothetical protein
MAKPTEFFPEKNFNDEKGFLAHINLIANQKEIIFFSAGEAHT